MNQLKIKELRTFAKNISSVYQAIAKRIEELLVLTNEVRGSSDQHTLDLSTRIIQFLDSLRSSVKQEKKLAKGLTNPESRKQFLALIQKELLGIKKLEAFIELSKRRPTPEIITKIHQLYQEIKTEIDAQEAVLKEAA